MAPFKETLAAAPDRLRRAIADLAAEARAAGGADPYKAVISVPREGGEGTDLITVAEAIRRRIGREVETLTLAFEQAIETAQTVPALPSELDQIMRETRRTVGIEIVSLNEILREAFDADPAFWRRMEQRDNGLATASPRAAEAMRRIEGALRALDRALAVASLQAVQRREAAVSRAQSLQERLDFLTLRVASMGAAFNGIPLGMDSAARLYPLVAGVAAVTVLVRLRRLMALRRALHEMELDLAAPSWVAGSASAPGRWWALLLVLLPTLATLHAAYAAAADRALFAGPSGNGGGAAEIAYVTAYGAIALITLVQSAYAARELLS
jgi:hypothetical protein